MRRCASLGALAATAAFAALFVVPGIAMAYDVAYVDSYNEVPVTGPTSTVSTAGCPTR